MRDLPSRDELLDYLLSFDLFEQTGGEEQGIAYAKLHCQRFLKTLAWVPRLPAGARVLELGAAPYMMSFLIKKHFDYELVPANFFGDYGERLEPELSITLRSRRWGESHTFAFRVFNLELDPFPYGDGEFDLVLCCEILEHLAVDPAHMLREIHRVLKPGGHVLITTPNAIQLRNVARILRGENLFHQYSGGGVYERHNREYSPDELWALLQIHNFEPKLATQDAYAHGLLYRLLARTRLMRLRRDNLFAVGKKHGRSVERRPQWLYENPNGHQVARSNRVVMGEGDRPYLGPGWSDFEYWPPGIRWTGRRASAALLPAHGERRVGFRAARTSRAVAGRVSVNGFDAGAFALAANQAQEVVLPLPDAAWEQRLRGEAHAFQVAIAVDEPAGAPPDGEPTRGVPVEMIGLLD